MKSSAFWAALGVAVLSLGVVPASRADSHQEELRERTAVLIEHAYERDRILRDFDLDADAEGGRMGYGAAWATSNSKGVCVPRPNVPAPSPSPNASHRATS